MKNGFLRYEIFAVESFIRERFIYIFMNFCAGILIPLYVLIKEKASSVFKFSAK